MEFLKKVDSKQLWIKISTVELRNIQFSNRKIIFVTIV